jgi:hypothetical protein
LQDGRGRNQEVEEEAEEQYQKRMLTLIEIKQTKE